MTSQNSSLPSLRTSEGGCIKTTREGYSEVYRDWGRPRRLTWFREGLPAVLTDHPHPGLSEVTATWGKFPDGSMTRFAHPESGNNNNNNTPQV